MATAREVLMSIQQAIRMAIGQMAISKRRSLAVVMQTQRSGDGTLLARGIEIVAHIDTRELVLGSDEAALLARGATHIGQLEDLAQGGCEGGADEAGTKAKVEAVAQQCVFIEGAERV